MDPNNNINRRFGDCYVFSKTIGNGNFSLVRKVRHKFSRSIYAAKIVKLPLHNNNDMIGGEDDYQDILDMMRGEVAVMRRLKHNNLLQFVDVFYTREQVILLTELAEHGDLHDYFETLDEQLPEQIARSFCLQIASAINYMHSTKIAHRDLKPENVLLFKQKQDTNFTLKLCDFGLAEEATSLGFTRVCGSPSYVAPEILEFKSYGLAVDIWSMGILFYLIICKYVPFEDTDMNRKFELIMKSRLEFPEDEWSSVSKEAKQLIGLMLEKNPRRRIKAGSVFHNKWFRGTTTTRSFLKRMNPLSFKTAARALLINRDWGNNRDDAILTKRLVENTFLFKKTCNGNIKESGESNDRNDDLKNNLGKTVAEMHKQQPCSEVVSSPQRLQCSTDHLPVSVTIQKNRLPPINQSNSVLRAASDERIRESRRARHKPS